MAPFTAAEPAAPVAAMAPRAHRVAATRQETHDTWTLELEPAAEPLPGFAPGQFAMLMAAGVGEVPVSVSAVPGDGRLVHTVRAVGAVTERICAAQAGDELGVRGPLGRGWPLDEVAAADVVVVAGGIGIAPLRPVIHQLPARAGRLLVLYGARAPQELLYTDEFGDWRERGVELAVIVDAAAPGWSGRVGVVPKLVARAAFEPERALALVVGPEAMMRFTVDALRDRGVAAERIHISMERNMQCGVGHCGHCQLGPLFVCKDGPVVRYDLVEPWLGIREL